MKINIPNKLKSYKDYIKEKSNYFVHSQNLSLLKIGESKKENQYKEIYLCYNPFTTSLQLDINYFNKDKDIYKMYPQSFVIPPREIYAFLTFSSSQAPLTLDENYVIFQKRNKIASLINGLDKTLPKTGDFVVETDDSQATMLFDDDFINHLNNSKNRHDIKKITDEIRLERQSKYNKDNNLLINIFDYGFDEEKSKFKITIEMVNLNTSEKVVLDSFAIKISEGDNEQTIVVGNEITIDSQSKKKTLVYLDKELEEAFNLDEAKFEIVREV